MVIHKTTNQGYLFISISIEEYRLITGAIKVTSRENLYNELGLQTLCERRHCHKLIFFYKIVNGLLPNYLRSHLEFSSNNHYPLRSANSLHLKQKPPSIRTLQLLYC